jgi:catechol 2,3-dioxygenase-like lactoylglutathione lyase family enzyme
MIPLTEVRRFLHVHYNCHDAPTLEHFYHEVFGLRTVMRSVSGPGEGPPFGLYEEIECEVTFLYDHRGGRRSCSLELIEWRQPAPTTGSLYPHPWYPGIQSVAYSAADLDAVVVTAEALGASLVRRGDGWLVLRDPEGLPVEVIRSDGPSEFSYIRLVCSDLERSIAWWSQLGFTEGTLQAPPGHDIWPGDETHRISNERCVVGSDDPSFGVVFTTWSGSQPNGRTYGTPYHHGLYRMATAVDDIHESYEALRDAGLTRQTPHTFQLRGSKLGDGLTILFLTDPDGVTVELVDRPRIGP